MAQHDKLDMKEGISKLAITIVEWHNPDMDKWDTKMYREKEEIIRMIEETLCGFIT